VCSPNPIPDIDFKTFINRNALSAEEARIGYDLTFAKFGQVHHALEMRQIGVLTALQDVSNVRSRFIGAGAALQAFNILATSATPWGEEDPERRDSLISTAALEAGKWVHTTLAYSKHLPSS